MNLYIIRHAHALPLNDTELQADEERPLSQEGEQQVIAMAGALNKLGVRFDRVLTSPLLRARQTAEGLARHLELPGGSLENTEHLEPAGSGKKLTRLLRSLEGEQVALVGHEPDLSRLTAWLIGSKRAQIDLAKAGMACLVCDGPARKGAAALAWLVTPAWLSSAPPSSTGEMERLSHRGREKSERVT